MQKLYLSERYQCFVAVLVNKYYFGYLLFVSPLKDAEILKMSFPQKPGQKLLKSEISNSFYRI